jgi:hypothetical protein
VRLDRAHLRHVRGDASLLRGSWRRRLFLRPSVHGCDGLRHRSWRLLSSKSGLRRLPRNGLQCKCVRPVPMTKGRCACGSEVLASTEEWSAPKCIDCWAALGGPVNEPDWTRVALTSRREPPSSEVTPEDRERARAWWVRICGFISKADDRKVESLAGEFAAARRGT